MEDENLIQCDKCNGVGEIISKEYHFADVCPKCRGRGKIDWVRNVMWRKPRVRSALDNVNIRRMTIHLQKELEKVATENFDKLECCAIPLLDTYKGNKLIYDYKFYKAPDYFEVMFQPSRTVEFVRIQFKFLRDS